MHYNYRLNWEPVIQKGLNIKLIKKKKRDKYEIYL